MAEYLHLECESCGASFLNRNLCHHCPGLSLSRSQILQDSSIPGATPEGKGLEPWAFSLIWALAVGNFPNWHNDTAPYSRYSDNEGDVSREHHAVQLEDQQWQRNAAPPQNRLLHSDEKHPDPGDLLLSMYLRDFGIVFHRLSHHSHCLPLTWFWLPPTAYCSSHIGLLLLTSVHQAPFLHLLLCLECWASDMPLALPVDTSSGQSTFTEAFSSYLK